MKYSITIEKNWLSVGEKSSVTFERSSHAGALYTYHREVELIRKLQQHHRLSAVVELLCGKKLLEQTKLTF